MVEVICEASVSKLPNISISMLASLTFLSRVGYREPVPIWNRFQYNRYLAGPKCNADFGASFRCLRQLNTVARQIPWGTCKTAPAPNVNFVLCRSRSLVFSSKQSYDSKEQAAFQSKPKES